MITLYHGSNQTVKNPKILEAKDGRYTKEEAINHLMPQNLKDQFAFLTEKSLQLLKFIEVKEI